MIGTLGLGRSATRCACGVRLQRAPRRYVHASTSRRQEVKPKSDEMAESSSSFRASYEPNVNTDTASESSSGSGSSSPRASRSGSKVAWQLPAAWRSQLDPNAPWRKSMLEQRRRWLDQAGSQLTAVGLKLNEVTGYKEVERLKELVGEKGKP